MNFDEKLDISDMVKCADNFYKTLDMALKIETDNLKVVSDDEEGKFLYRFARSAMIQVFEVTVEISWKMMQRWIKINADKDIIQKPKRELFRTAHQCGLISDPIIWWDFYGARNKTSHTYHEEIAEEVYALSKELPFHLKDFIKRLDERR